MKKLLTLFTLLLCVCSGAWGAVTYSGSAPATTTHLVGNENKTFLDVANTETNAKIKDGDATFALGLHYIINTLKPAWASGSGANSTTSSTAATDYGFLNNYSTSSYDAYTQAYGNAQIKSSQETVLYVTGITGFAVWGKDNGTGNNKQLIIKVAEIASNGTIGSDNTTTSSANTSDHLTTYGGSTLNGQSFYRITLTTGSTSACATYQVRFTPYVDPRPAAPISWSAVSSTAVISQDNTFPTLTNTNDLTVSYSSSNTGVATINASTGVITLVAKGSTTITATYTTTGSSDTYKTTKVSYTLTVSNIAAVSEKFWKFSDAAWSSYTQSASPQTIDNMYIISNSASDLPVQDCETSYSDESLNFTKHLYTSGSSTDSRRVLNICVAPNSKISVYAAASGTGGRSLYISNGSYNNTSDQNAQATSSTTIFKLSHVNVAGGDVFIHNTNGYYIYGIKVEPLKCGSPTFSPNGGSIEEGGSVTITSTDAATIKYAWTADNVDTPDSWTSADATDDAIVVTVPNATDNTPRLHAYGIKSGYTDGDVAYVDFSITGVDTTAPTLTAQSVENNATDVAVADNITLTFDENVQVADASKVTLTGGEATISSVTAADNVVTIAYTGLANNTTYTLAVASGAITDVAAAQNAYAGTSFSFTTVKASMPAPKINGLGYFIGSQTVSITSDVDGATITYSLDGENYSAYTEPFEITADKTVYAKATHTNYAGEGSTQMAMYIITVPSEQEDVTAATTWDFTDANDMKPSSDVTNDPVPTSQIVSDVTQYESVDKAAKLSFIKPQRYDDEGYVQAHGFIINTTIPGTLEIKYLGGKNGNTRWLTVNGVGQSSNNSTGSSKTTSNIVIPAGTTIVYGFDVTSNPNAVNNLRYQTITFTAVTSVSGTITDAGWNTFSSSYALDLSTITGGAAYVATTNDNTEVTLTETSAKVAAGTGLMIKGTAGETFTIGVTSDAATLTRDNLLVGLPNGGKVAKDDYNYVFAWTTGDVSTAGFWYVNDAEPTLGAGKAYLHSESSNGAKLNIIIDNGETTSINSIENGELRSENYDYYNLAGQKVGKDYKGIVIVNGKKYLRK